MYLMCRLKVPKIKKGRGEPVSWCAVAANMLQGGNPLVSFFSFFSFFSPPRALYVSFLSIG